jgi:IS30 family transposase
LYNYIEKDVFLGIGNKDLWVKRNSKKQEYRRIRPAYNNLKGRSIEERDKAILQREEYGHWEIDTVVGKGRAALLVMTNRKTRYEIIRKLKSRSQTEVIKALDKIERKLGTKRFREEFKTITADNGGEFLSQEGMERSCINSKKKRTEVYYCYPYSAWERGSNENANKFIRRFIPKGANIADYSEKEIERIEHYINNYPRKLFAGYTANSLTQTTA